jgi:hypothetical protein
VNWFSEYGQADMEWFSDGKGLALTKGEEYQRQIYYLSYPSGKLTPITNDPNDYAGAALSQDSKSLVTTQASYTCSIWGALSNNWMLLTNLLQVLLSMMVKWVCHGLRMEKFFFHAKMLQVSFNYVS